MQFLSLLVNKEDVQVILSPKRDQHQFSSNNITTQSRVDAKVMRMIKSVYQRENAFIFYQIILIS